MVVSLPERGLRRSQGLTHTRSSFSETLGRRSIYIISFSLFVVFSVLSAISTNIGMLIAMRILGGGASASVQAVGAGTIADLWETVERGKAMSAYLSPSVSSSVHILTRYLI